ncbi:hypothetical protein A0H81_09596 [Grifola frondosa]|uniref:DUF6699 domain-containing protein n=1 Tax=Grifola frondosa TaxID=5627 RepID=A0A1C7M065_GRIFR|nr:hypothetical protein A0H81_09596 [Grifola frondosa]
MPGMAPAPGALPFPSPTMMYAPLPHMVNLAPVPPQDYMRARRRSDSYLPQPAWVAFPVQPMAYRNPSPQLHPLLDGETAGGPLLLFDISLSKFNPQTPHARECELGDAAHARRAHAAATHPGIHHMAITCDAIPDWPITLEPHSTARERSRERSPFLNVTAATAETAPITVYDVLMAIHRHLQRQISHVDWARLGSSDATAASARVHASLPDVPLG